MDYLIEPSNVDFRENVTCGIVMCGVQIGDNSHNEPTICGIQVRSRVAVLKDVTCGVVDSRLSLNLRFKIGRWFN